MYLGLDIIIKIKFTTIFDRCAILNVLNYLTKNFESWWAYSQLEISTHKTDGNSWIFSLFINRKNPTLFIESG